ncbi:MAG: hypothetical protein C0483_23590 [Pirellula sp.]|nr:hypothetical protein [Pirellula sp.]
MRPVIVLIVGLALCAQSVCLAADEAASEPLYSRSFSMTRYGGFPDGWRDHAPARPNPNWIVTGGTFRPVAKRKIGFATYEGYLTDGTSARSLVDARIRVIFRKTTEPECVFGVAVRVQDARNYYLARYVGDRTLQWVIIADGKETVAAETTDRQPLCTEEEQHLLEVTLQGDRLTVRRLLVGDIETARVDIQDARFTKGACGLVSSPYAAMSELDIHALAPAKVVHTPEQVAKRNARLSTPVRHYPVVPPLQDATWVNTASNDLAAEYDVVVAGAGTGGCGAAIQAARLDCRVLLLEETDWIGGQMAAAGVTTMDEDSVWMKFPVRERGIYREFHESMVAYYRTRDKDPFVAYYGNPQMEGGYEPKVARAVLAALIEDASRRYMDHLKPKRVHVSTQSRVVAVRREGNVVRGVTIEIVDDSGKAQRKDIACKVLVDATEYGDVLPLAGVQYRVSNQISGDPIDMASPIQDHTWTAIVREYHEGVPEHLQIKSPPPGYEDYSAKRYRKFQRYGLHQWGVAAKGIKGPRDYRVYFAWRGMADSASPLTGMASELRHTRCGFNGGNDYSVTAATCEDPAQRLLDERRGIYLTLGALYYFQHELGLNWSLAEDEGYDTPYNRAKMKALDLRSDLEPLARHLPQMPYVRESRRMVGVDTLKVSDLGRYEHAKHVTHSVAMGDYFMDLDHGRTSHVIEADLDVSAAKIEETPRGGGPFQVPMEVFLPEKLDGFLAAEKNFSQSRIANGATRLQPITMLTGQAVGTMAALSVKRNVQPRELSPLEVQSVLLDSGSTLIQRWYVDVPWGTPIWKATQLLSLYQVLDRPGAIDKDNNVPLGGVARWGVDEPLKPAEREAALAKLAALKKLDGDDRAVKLHDVVTAGEFALLAAELLLLPNPSAAPAKP